MIRAISVRHLLIIKYVPVCVVRQELQAQYRKMGCNPDLCDKSGLLLFQLLRLPDHHIAHLSHRRTALSILAATALEQVAERVLLLF